MKRICYFLFAIAVCAMTTGCQKEDPSLDVKTVSISCSSIFGSSPCELEILTNTSWTASCDEEWVHLTPTSGNGSSSYQIINVTLDDNTDNKIREATITVTAGDLQETVSVKQDAVSLNVEISDAPVTFSNLGGSASFKVKSNYDWNASTDAEWLKVNTVSGSASIEPVEVSLTAESNPGEARDAVVTIVADGKSFTANVSQAAALKVEISDAPVNFSAVGGSASFKVKSNYDWNASTDAKWLTVNTVSGSASSEPVEVSLTAESNSGEARDAVVTIVAEGKSFTANVSQAAAPKPEVGDYYFSDGTFGSELVAGKTPIAVVFYVGCASDKADSPDYYFKKDGTTPLGKVNGYAVALKNATDSEGKKTDYYYSSRSSFSNKEPNVSMDKTDFLGYSNLRGAYEYAAGKYGGLTVDNYPAVYYTNTVFDSFYPSPAQTSGWFVPSLGQLQYIWDNFFNSDYENSALDAKFTVAGGDKMWAKDSYYWSSTATDNYLDQMWIFVFNSGSWSSRGYADIDRREWGYYTCKVRPILVF